MAPQDDFYSQIAAASASGGGTYIADGVYKLMVEKMFEKRSTHAGGSGLSFITEFRVIESAPHPDYPDVKPNAVGTTCSVVCSVQKHASAMGNVKAILLGLLGAFGYTEDMIGPEQIQSAFNSDELKGILVENTTYRKAIKTGVNAGKPITLNKWTSIEQTEEDVARQRADLEAGKFKPVKKTETKPLLKSSAAVQAETETEEVETPPPAKKSSLLKRPSA